MFAENILGVALAALMGCRAERKAHLRAEALQRIADSGENDRRKFLLAECIQAYMALDERQWEEFQQLLVSREEYQGVHMMMQTMYERGMEEGLELGRQEGSLEGKREALMAFLEGRFGPLGPDVNQRLKRLGAEQLQDVLRTAATAPSLEALGLGR